MSETSLTEIRVIVEQEMLWHRDRRDSGNGPQWEAGFVAALAHVVNLLDAISDRRMR